MKTTARDSAQPIPSVARAHGRTSTPRAAAVDPAKALDLFEERRHLINRHSEDGRLIGGYFKDIADRLIAAGSLKLSSTITFHLEDSDQLSAYVSQYNGTARIVLSKKLVNDFAKSEDELAFIIGHELMHVKFAEMLDKRGNHLRTSKAEEYYADVGGVVTSMAKAGYAPHAAIQLLDRLQHINVGECSLLRPWVAEQDEHGLTVNRAAAVQGAIAKLRKSRGAVPEQTRQINPDAAYTATFATHTSTVQVMIDSPEYAQGTDQEKWGKLIGALKELPPECAHRIPELAAELENILRNKGVSTAELAQIYTLVGERPFLSGTFSRSVSSENRKFSDSLLRAVWRAVDASKSEPALPQEVAAVISAVKSFISNKDDGVLLQSAKTIADFVRAWQGADPCLNRFIKATFSLENYSDGTSPPWKRQLDLARTMEKHGNTEVVEALWACGVYDERLLAIAPDRLLQKLASRSVPLPELAKCSCADRFTFQDGTLSQKNDFRTGFESLREEYCAEAEQLLASREQNRRIKAKKPHPIKAYSTIAEVPVSELARACEAHLSAHAEHLTHPRRSERADPAKQSLKTAGDVAGAGEERRSRPVDDQTSEHYSLCRELAKKFKQMLSLQDTTLKKQANAAVRRFFLAKDGPCLRTMIGISPVDSISPVERCTHPLITYITECPALTSEEKLNLLRPVEQRLDQSVWEKVYFSAERDLSTEQKLERLITLSPFHEPTQQLGAKLLVTLCEDNAPGDLAIGELLARYRLLVPGTRSLPERDRRSIAEHIEREKEWDLPLTTKIDAFWALEQGRLFPPQETGVTQRLREEILAGLTRIEDPAERAVAAERLLLSPASTFRTLPSFGRSGTSVPELESEQRESEAERASKQRQQLNQNTLMLSLKDPVLRAEATTIWSAAQRALLAAMLPEESFEGRDTGRSEYFRVALPHLEQIAARLKAHAPIQERRELFDSLAESLVLQQPLTFKLRDALHSVDHRDIAETDRYVRATEAGLELINQDPDRRHALVEFLTRPLSRDSIVRFATQGDLDRSREFSATEATLHEMRRELAEELLTPQQRPQHLSRNSIDLFWEDLAKLDFKVDSLSTEIESNLVDWEWVKNRLSEALLAEFPGIKLGKAFKASFPRSLEEDLSRAQVSDGLRAVIPLVEQNLREPLTTDEAECKKAFERAAAMCKSEVKNIKDLKRAIAKEFVELTAYDFIDDLETLIERAKTPLQVQRVITAATNSLTGRFESLLQEQCSSLSTLLDGIAAEVETRSNNRKSAQSSLVDTHAEAKELITQLVADIRLSPSQKDAPWLHRLLHTTPTKFATEFVGNRLTNIRDELAALDIDAGLDAAFTNREKLISRKKMEIEILDNTLIPELCGSGSPLRRSPVSVRAMGEYFSSRAGEHPVDTQHADFEHGWEVQAALARTFLQRYPQVRDAIPPSATLKEEQQARQLYELFWSLDTEARAVTLKQLLLPPAEDHQDRVSGKDTHFRRAFEYVCAEIFPEEIKYGSKARRILDAFLQETDRSERGYILAGLMATAEKVANAPQSYSVGKRLAMVLAALGPAEKKLAQAINSHPLTPEDLREDIKDVKSFTDPLSRVELHERIERAVPKAYRDAALPYIGQTMGAASYWIAVDCQDTVLSVLREYARERARSGLDRMQRVAERLSQDPELQELAEPFRESIIQARQMVEIETNHKSGAIQQSHAWRRYEGLSVTVESEPFDFSSAQWRACGPEFRHQEKLLGTHFIDLTLGEENSPERAYARKAALAHLTAEFLNILSGDCFDHDRHGAQNKLRRLENGRNALGLFDHGCMALSPPSEQEKRELAQVVSDLLQNHRTNPGGILKQIHEILRQKREDQGRSPAYLISVERALLALNDFMKFDADTKSSLLKPNDLPMVISAVFRSGEVDPIFSKELINRFGGTASVFAGFLTPVQLGQKIADAIETRFDIQQTIGIARQKPRSLSEIITFDG